jgi:hypothetical protein
MCNDDDTWPRFEREWDGARWTVRIKPASPLPPEGHHDIDWWRTLALQLIAEKRQSPVEPTALIEDLVREAYTYVKAELTGHHDTHCACAILIRRLVDALEDSRRVAKHESDVAGNAIRDMKAEQARNEILRDALSDSTATLRAITEDSRRQRMASLSPTSAALAIRSDYDG